MCTRKREAASELKIPFKVIISISCHINHFRRSVHKTAKRFKTLPLNSAKQKRTIILHSRVVDSFICPPREKPILNGKLLEKFSVCLKYLFPFEKISQAMVSRRNMKKNSALKTEGIKFNIHYQKSFQEISFFVSVLRIHISPS